MTILIIEDDKDINVLAETALKYHSHTILQAYNGTDGLNICFAHSKEIDLIILDIMMPDIDGFEVFRKLKKNPATADIPCVFLSARADITELAEEVDDKNIKFISKPFNLEDFVIKIEEIYLQTKKDK